MIERQNEIQFLNQQRERLERRIRYARAVVNTGGPHAILKAQTLPMLIRARNKITYGNYFICDDCNGPINKKRLRHIPGAIKCERCQTRGESLLH